MRATRMMGIAVAVVAGALGLASVGQADLVYPAQMQAIYADDFDTGVDGSIDGQAPQVRPDTETWTASGIAKNTTAGLVDRTANGNAGLPMVFDDDNYARDDIYYAQATLFNTTTGSNWSAVGWVSSTTNAYNAVGAGKYWVLWRGTGNIRVFSHGATGASGSPTDVFTNGELVAGGDGVERKSLDLRSVLDWTLETPTWSVYYKNPSATEWTHFWSESISESNVNGIVRTGVSTIQAGAGAYYFEAGVIPEPGTLSVLGLGAVALLLRRRLNRARA